MNKRNKKIIIRIGWISIFALMALVVMLLWNLIMPDVTGCKSVNYWQSLGLTVLFRLLAGHFGFWGMHHGWNRCHYSHDHHHLWERMHGMSREERRDFIRDRLNELDKENSDDAK